MNEQDMNYYRIGFRTGKNYQNFKRSEIIVSSVNGTEAARLVRRALSEIRRTGDMHHIASVYYLEPSWTGATKDEECRNRLYMELHKKLGAI
jgi:hypothetical protein